MWSQTFSLSFCGLLLNNFNLTTGLGLPSTNYSKWAICGIASGTIDLKGRTLRYLDTTVLDYDTINKVGGFDNYTLTKDNIPAHRHTFSFLQPLMKISIKSEIIIVIYFIFILLFF